MPIPLYVLILADSAANAELVVRELRRAEFDPQWQRVDSEADFLAALNLAVDVIIADYSSPQFDGLRALELLQGRHLDIPFILVSGTISEETAIDAIKQGAADYVPKDRLARLGSVVARALEQKQLREAKRTADQAARDSEKRFRALIENSSDAIALVGLDGTILYASPGTIRMLGYEINEYVGRVAFEFVHPDDLQSAKEIFGQILQQPGIHLTAQARERHKDGSWRWLEGVATNLLDEPSVRAIVVNFRDITERKRAEEELRRRADEFASLYETTRDLAAPNELARVLNTVVERAVRLLRASSGALLLYDPTKAELELAVTKNFPAPLGIRQKIGEGLAGHVAQIRQPMIVDDYGVSEYRLPRYEGLSFRASLQVPMLDRGELIGVLGVIEIGESARKFTEDDANLLTLFAGQAASAVDNARLFQETRHRLAELETINKISTVLRTAQTVGEMLPVLLDETLDMLDADTGAVWLYDAVNDKLRETVARGWFTQIVEPPLRPRKTIAGHAVGTPQGVAVSRRGSSRELRGTDPAGDWRSATGEPYISREFAGDPLTRESARPHIPAGWGGAYVPIRSADEIVGVLFVSVELPRELTPSEVRLLTTLAEIAGNTIHRMRLHESLEEAYETTLEGWSSALDLRDGETEGHTRRVAELTLRLARAMGMSESELVQVRRGALLHDIGKMGITDKILHKHAALTPEEWKIMRMHPTFAYQLLKQIEFLLPALDIPYSHHERWDGTGYPRGLKGNAIPLAARIFTVVDVWDALCSERPYRPGWSEKRALRYIREQAGKHFDPKVVAHFLQTIGAEHETGRADKRRVRQAKKKRQGRE